MICMEMFGNGVPIIGREITKQLSKILVRSYLKILIQLVCFEVVLGMIFQYVVDLLFVNMVPHHIAMGTSVYVLSALHFRTGN